MKLLTTMTAAVLVMAATGCETTKQKEARGMVLTPAGNWVKKGTPYFGDGTSWLAPGQTAAFDGSVFTRAMAAQQQAPQPVIVVSPVVSQFGGYRPPIYTPPAPIYTGRRTPTVYTMPVYQP